MKVHEIMTRQVVTATKDMSIAAAIGEMVTHRIGGLPVINGQHRVIGILTESDFLHRAETGTGIVKRSALMNFLVGSGRQAEEYVDTHSRRVGDLMTLDVVTIDERERLPALVELMEQHQVRRIPVTCQQMLVGIVTRFDLVSALAEKLGAPTAAGSDAAIKKRLDHELVGQTWASNVTISVKNNIITLSGVVADERCRKALNVAAQNVGGGTTVRDNLTWMPSYALGRMY